MLNVRKWPSLLLLILLSYVHISGNYEDNNHNNNALLNQQPCLSSPFSCPSRLHVSQTAHGSRTTHALDARTPTRELHARSPVGSKPALELRSAVVPARSPQPSQGEAKLPAASHRDRNGRQRARTKTHAKHGKAGNQSHARRKEGQAGQLTRPNFHPDIQYTVHVWCVPLLFASPTVHTYCLVLLLSEPPRASPIHRVPVHALRVRSGWPRWRELSHAPVRNIPSCCGAVWCDL